MRNKMMILVLAAATGMLSAIGDSKTLHWHFSGVDGVEAPTSITDTAGDLTLTRYQNGDAQNRVLTKQLSSNDDILASQAAHMWWLRDGVVHVIPRHSGSVQMYRYELTNDVPKIRHSAYYSLNDSAAVKTLFPTNASGDLLPFTIEIVFKAAPLDSDAYNSTAANFNLLTLSRNTGTTTGNTVFRLNAISTGALQLQCESKSSGNGDVCNLPTMTSADYRDGDWHHLAMTYSLDETVEPHQGTVRVYLDGFLKKEEKFSRSSSVRSLKYTEYVNGAVVENSAYFSVGSIENRGVDLCVSELRVTQAALSPKEFIQFGNREVLKERFSGTIARWTFDAPGHSGDSVGSEYGSIKSAEGLDIYELAGATFISASQNWNAEGQYPPLFTNDIPCAVVWDLGSGRIVNPENSTSVFFQHESPDGESNGQSKIGSSVYSRNSTLDEMNFIPSNITYECFVKQDKKFRANVSGLFGLVSGSSIFTRLDLVHGAEPRHLIAVNNVSIRTSRMVLEDGKWHHVAANYDTSSGTSVVAKLWVDYELIGSTETVGINNSIKHDKLQVVFGAGNGVYAFSGMIDEPRISMGDIGPDRFLRAFVPREDLTSAWLVPTNSVITGSEWHSPETFWLRGTWANGAVTVSDDIPAVNSVLRLDGRNIPVQSSVGFSGEGGITIPCAALTGTNVFTVEANFCGTGEVLAKKSLLVHDAWAVGADDEGLAYVELNGVRTTTAVNAGDGCWHHVALAVDRTSAETAVLYLDGVAVQTIDASDMTVDPGDFVIGEDFRGSIVGVRFSAGVPPKRFFIARPPYGTVFTVR